jgi:hypothetical protein
LPLTPLTFSITSGCTWCDLEIAEGTTVWRTAFTPGRVRPSLSISVPAASDCHILQHAWASRADVSGTSGGGPHTFAIAAPACGPTSQTFSLRRPSKVQTDVVSQSFLTARVTARGILDGPPRECLRGCRQRRTWRLGQRGGLMGRSDHSQSPPIDPIYVDGGHGRTLQSGWQFGDFGPRRHHSTLCSRVTQECLKGRQAVHTSCRQVYAGQGHIRGSRGTGPALAPRRARGRHGSPPRRRVPSVAASMRRLSGRKLASDPS